MTEHCLLSPSKASRWMRCPGSIYLESKYKDNIKETFSNAAIIGTMVHKLIELSFNEGISPTKIYKKYYSAYFNDPRFQKDYITHLFHAERYIDWIASLIYHQDLTEAYFETKVFFPKYPIYGTIDMVGYNSRRKSLYIVDFKYGKTLVPVENNYQVILYSISAINSFNWDPLNITMQIYQPLLDNYSSITLTYDRIIYYRSKFESVIKDILYGYPKCIPGDIQCRFCPVKEFCLEYQNV